MTGKRRGLRCPKVPPPTMWIYCWALSLVLVAVHKRRREDREREPRSVELHFLERPMHISHQGQSCLFQQDIETGIATDPPERRVFFGETFAGEQCQRGRSMFARATNCSFERHFSGTKYSNTALRRRVDLASSPTTPSDAELVAQKLQNY